LVKNTSSTNFFARADILKKMRKIGLIQTWLHVWGVSWTYDNWNI